MTREAPLPLTPDSLRQSLSSLGPVMLYGKGSIAREIHQLLLRNQIEVRSFLDLKCSPSDTINDLPVLHPDDSAFDTSTRQKTTVVIAIFNAFVDMPALHARLAAFGWVRIISFTNLHAAFPEEIGDRYWLTQRVYYDSYTAEIAATRLLLADAKSLDIFDRTLAFRTTGDYALLPAPETTNQYFPNDLPVWRTPLRLIDCGACDGDTYRHLRGTHLSVGAYVAFEPDLTNFAALSREVAKPDGAAPTTFSLLCPCGVWSDTRQLRFSTGKGGASALTAEGDIMIQCISLDEALPSFAPTLIKMDIEGAEIAALQGAQKMICTHRPGLAICVYHEPAHLWLIPALIKSWNLGYRFFLRSHAYSGFDLVLYALPA